jgi:SAM-dependent methyltransferase
METPVKKVGTVRLQNMSYGHKQAGALRAAIEIGLFTAVSKGGASLPALQERLGLSALNTERIVVACTAMGLLELGEGVYTNAPDVERFLVKEKASYIGPWLQFNGWDFESWKDLAGNMTSGERPKVLGLYESLTDDMAKVYHEATYTVGLGAGMLFAKDVDMTDRASILDLGGGSGAYCIAAVNSYPHLKCVVFDFEPVCRIADGFIAQWGMQDSISTHPGDFTRDPFPGDADVMIMASNLPQYNDAMLTKIFKKAFDALQPGGEFHLVGETLDNDKSGPLGPALWGLHEALFGSEGRGHSEKEVMGYLASAGFSDIEVHPFVPGSLTRITGKKEGI